MTHPTILEEVLHEGITYRRHADYPMFSVSEDGLVLGARGFRLNPQRQPSGHMHVSYFDAEGKQRFIHVHRMVALCYVPNENPDTLIKVDHKDNNPENNHYSNLRWVTARQNCQNLAKNKNGETTSKYVGVSWKERDKRWIAQIRLDGKNKGLGSHKVAEDAARAYDKALVGAGMAPVNFPLETTCQIDCF